MRDVQCGIGNLTGARELLDARGVRQDERAQDEPARLQRRKAIRSRWHRKRRRRGQVGVVIRAGRAAAS